LFIHVTELSGGICTTAGTSRSSKTLTVGVGVEAAALISFKAICAIETITIDTISAQQTKDPRV